MGTVLHWSTGAALGVVYALMLGRRTFVGSGLLYGLLAFLALDEGFSAAVGLPPKRFPWQAHARGLAGHAVLGAVTEAGVRGLKAGTDVAMARLGTETPSNGV